MKNLKLYESFMSGLPLEKAIGQSMESGRPVLLSAAPDTRAVAAVAKEADNIGCPMIHVDCARLAPEDIEIPSLRDEKTVLTPAVWLPYDNSGGPIILLLDEINRAGRQVLDKLMKLAYSRSLGSYSLPANCVVVLRIHSNDSSGDFALADRSIPASL